MEPFPHRYTVVLANRQLLAAPREPIALGPPPQFGGSHTVWSPEDLLVGAALECLWTTFEALARRDTLSVHDWSGTGTGVLDRGPKGPVFTSITLAVEVEVDTGEEERARLLVVKADKQCIIANALNVPITLQVTVRGRPARATG
jgi:organic hydroperoxide reductase OsmC/OhrA